jgi:ribulose-phosphate 3-epimerase
MTIVAPSVLSMDYSKMAKQLDELDRSCAQWLHFDVMDGHFTPNLTFGPEILKGFAAQTRLFLDVHLMVEEPRNFVKKFVDAGAQQISFHTEVMDNDCAKINDFLDEIHGYGVKAGWTLRPETPIEQFEDALDKTDCVMIMSVVPGFGGQSFMYDQLDKVRWLKKKREEKGLDYKIEIDGGIKEGTGKTAREAGVDVLVAGSYIFDNDIISACQSLMD